MEDQLHNYLINQINGIFGNYNNDDDDELIENIIDINDNQIINHLHIPPLNIHSIYNIQAPSSSSLPIHIPIQSQTINNMTTNNKPKKHISLAEYLFILEDKCSKLMEIDKTTYTNQRMDNNGLNNNNYLFILNNKFTIQQLKAFAKQNKLKISGTKPELIKRIYVYFKLSSNIIKVQKVFRGHLQKKYNKYHGPAFLKRELCTNQTDFLTIESLNEIPMAQFFSYTDVDGFTYGFDIISLYNLILKSGISVKNPYNRNKIPIDVNENIRTLIRLSKILKIRIDINIQDVNMDITQKKSLELKILDLFQNINALGNYSDPIWFSSLNKNQIIKFMRELQDIWEFRAQLTNETKMAICPPNGNLFANCYINSIYHEQNILNIQKIILPVLEKLVNNGIDQDNRSLGAYYVLASLTLVNPNAASALPWLYQSVVH